MFFQVNMKKMNIQIKGAKDIHIGVCIRSNSNDH